MEGVHSFYGRLYGRLMGLTKLVIRGARQHNLKNISVEIPRNSLTVITGLSGSGKSSLAFDTIYAEGQRRYVESLSAYARQFLDQMERPEVDVIEGLSPSIAIEQKTTTRSPRSTVGTITEIYDYLRVIYASVGAPHCPNCGKPITRQSSEQIVQAILHGEICKPGDRIMILAPIVRGRKGAFRKELEKFAEDGYVRVRINGELFPLDDLPVIDKRKNHTIEIVIDRLLVKQGIAARLEQSIATRHRRHRRRQRTYFFRKARLPRFRHLRSAARAAFLQLQFDLRRLPRVQRSRLEIRFRSLQDHHRLDPPALRWRPWPGLRLRDSQAHFGIGRLRPRL